MERFRLDHQSLLRRRHLGHDARGADAVHPGTLERRGDPTGQLRLVAGAADHLEEAQDRLDRGVGIEPDQAEAHLLPRREVALVGDSRSA